MTSGHRTVFHGGTVWTGDPPGPARGWVAVRDGSVEAVGADPVPPADVTQGAAEVDLGGGHLIPAFSDPHTHVLYAAMRPLVHDGGRLRSRAEAVAAVRDAAARTPDGAWILFLGVDHRSWDPPARPTRSELDAAAGDRPVLLADETIHEGVANSAALRASGVAWLPDAHGDIDRDRRGRPTGLVWERAFGRVMRPALRSVVDEADATDPLEALRALIEELLGHGVVRIHEGAVPPDLVPLLEELRASTPMEISWSLTAPIGTYEPPALLEDILDVPTGDAPRWVKLFADGGHRCAVTMPLRAALGGAVGALRRTVARRDTAFLAPLTERRTTLRGSDVAAGQELRFTDDQLVALLRRCEEVGVRPRVHAVGDLAATQVVRCAQRAGISVPWSLEHAMLLRDRDPERIAAAHVVNVQPRLLPDYAPAVEEVGADDAVSVVPISSLHRAGARLAISSDDPNDTVPPLDSLRIAVTRRLPDGSVHDPDEAAPRSVALRAATIGAVVAMDRDVDVAIAPGSRADLAVLSGDPFTPGTEVLQTWVRGDRVHPGG